MPQTPAAVWPCLGCSDVRQGQHGLQQGLAQDRGQSGCWLGLGICTAGANQATTCPFTWSAGCHPRGLVTSQRQWGSGWMGALWLRLIPTGRPGSSAVPLARWNLPHTLCPCRLLSGGCLQGSSPSTQQVPEAALHPAESPQTLSLHAVMTSFPVPSSSKKVHRANLIHLIFL